MDTIRSASRPERHFADSFITVRQEMARVLTGWLPRCPCCHRSNPGSRGKEWAQEEDLPQ